ncbi:HEPN domain-containing protein [Patescibacteria group bacterium]|nr:HEPN domain-containing protein [Patescibacteria group bacterium]MCG2701879.1 HEPN domain-containing protein [Candidatus Parcubacteria bacterium]MBU4264448.1 HEPN domain-containing protein [Patescibacteria group bacterium]MBU4390212.1 HEPN domain-containing protein [Patescibacteria group bacterium]MBU4397214.1 HEPN domain-containing protein [Patescibacteria group bacterium]
MRRRWRGFDWCLFIWQLVIEKTLKARLFNFRKKALWTHNLVLLCDEGGIKLDVEEEKELNEISSFNIEARYDDIKYSFYKKATKKYTEKWTKICEKFYKRFKKGLL